MNLRRALKKIPYLGTLCRLSRKSNIKVWLVGGFLRDIFLKRDREFLDFDFCVEKKILSFVHIFKRYSKAKIVVLDEKQKSYRLVIKRDKKIYTYDFTQLRGKNLEEDLSLRDFIMNTLALEINILPRIEVIDLLGARFDLFRRRIRVVNERVIKDDPLRILRAFSFSANYNFKIEKRTEKILAKYRKLLKKVSGERINEELFKILSVLYSYPIIKKMSELFILDEIIPYVKEQRNVFQGAYHHLDVWGHSLEALLRFEILFKKRLSKDKRFIEYLYTSLTSKHRLIDIIKLACLLHDVGKPFAKRVKNKKTIFHTHEKIGAELMEKIYQRLKLSFKEKEVLKHLIFWHLRPGYLADQEYPSKRAVYRFFRDAGDEGVAVILLSLADWRATRGPLTDSKKRRRHERIMLKLIDYYFKEKQKKPLPKLVDGFDIMRKFKLKPSPLIGEILKRIKEEQALGKITTKLDAYSLAQAIIKKRGRYR